VDKIYLIYRQQRELLNLLTLRELGQQLLKVIMSINLYKIKLLVGKQFPHLSLKH